MIMHATAFGTLHPGHPKMLSTTVIGSYPQPDWLLDKSVLRAQRVPRVSQPGLWRVAEALREQAIEDATRLAVRDMEDAGIDVITDGEIGRESYSNHFLGALDGIDFNHPTTITDRRGREVVVPRVTGPIARRSFVEKRAATLLRRLTSRRTKVTLPGPFTLAQQCHDEHYRDREALAFAFAQAVNAEARDLAVAGVDVIQIDEPWFRNDPDAARHYGVKLVNATFAGVGTTTALHMCFGYGFLVPGAKPRAYDFLSELADTRIDQISIECAQPRLDLAVLAALKGKTIMLGVLDLSTNEIDHIDAVADRIRAGLRYVDPTRLIPAPDCGMKYLSREAAFGKLAVLSEAATRVRGELA